MKVSRKKFGYLLIPAVLLVLLCVAGLHSWGRLKTTTVLATTENNPHPHKLDFSSRPWQKDENLRCDKWAVVAPSDSEWVSEAVRRQVRLHDWCLVIVFEKKPSVNYDPGWYPGRGNKAVIYLTQDDRKSLSDIPWSDTERKVFGYLYAITHGATVIWDFDDNNMLKFWIPGAAPKGAPSIETTIPVTESIEVREPQGHTWPTYNPYPALGAPKLPSWPRGLPLDDALREECSKGELKVSQVQNRSIAVLLSLIHI